MLAKPQSGDLGRDRIEGAAYLRGSVRLGIPKIEMAWAAGEPKEDDRFPFALVFGGFDAAA